MAEQRIGRYTVLEEIASGTQGAVCRAFDTDTSQIVALKVLHPSLSGNRDYLERFQREATITSSIDHPNVVKIHEVGEAGGRHFIAMEFLPESLGRLIESSGRLPIPAAVSFATQIADGLAAAHARGVVHRDIKPQNVLVAPDGTAKVTDFGIARGESLATMTATGMMMGTPYYMSPEQCRGERADARSDIYSLGCVLYQMLSGGVPFDAPTPLVVLRQHTEEPPRPIREVRENIPASLSDIVARALEKDPERRFPDMAAVADTLRVAVPELAVSPPPAQETSPPPPPFAPAPAPPPPPPPPLRPRPAPSVAPQREVDLVCMDCGVPWRTGGKYCTRCGGPNFRAATAGVAVPPGARPVFRYGLASPIRRIAAFFMDLGIWFAVWWVSSFMAGTFFGYDYYSGALFGAGLYFYWGCMLGLLAVYAYGWAKGWTPGKLLLGIRVVRLVPRVQELLDEKTDVVIRGQAPGIWVGLLRDALGRLLVVGLLWGLGLLWILWDRKQQGWHDKLAGTTVVIHRGRRYDGGPHL